MEGKKLKCFTCNKEISSRLGEDFAFNGICFCINCMKVFTEATKAILDKLESEERWEIGKKIMESTGK